MPLSLIRCTHVVPLFLRCCVICHMVLIALKCGKVLRLPLRSYRQYNRISQFQFDSYMLPLSANPALKSEAVAAGHVIFCRQRMVSNILQCLSGLKLAKFSMHGPLPFISLLCFIGRHPDIESLESYCR